MSGAFTVGTWYWQQRQSAPCRVVDRQDMWGENVYRVGLPAKDAVVRARATELMALENGEPSADTVLHTATAAKLLDALEDKAMALATPQSTAVPYPFSLDQPLAYVVSKSEALEPRSEGSSQQFVALQASA